MKQIKKYEFRMMLPVVQRKLKSFTSDEMNEFRLDEQLGSDLSLIHI